MKFSLLSALKAVISALSVQPVKKMFCQNGNISVSVSNQTLFLSSNRFCYSALATHLHLTPISVSLTYKQSKLTHNHIYIYQITEQSSLITG